MKLLPQEIEVWYVLPALRKEMVSAMVKKGLKQKDIAKVMGITEASVSQYLSGKRGAELEIENKTIKTIEEKTNQLIKNPNDYIKILSTLSKQLMKKGIVCKFHKKTDKNVPKTCQVCKSQTTS
ncbi:MAG: helix-turn-helix domain-containing protein [Nanoarchaeota archaeon]|nr:helix-turn-helix domain-containing protein [Nanoarchaeota archaeon]